jgi:8-oxo-dGTP pyrophosphatase MutT (NUDIX family)
VAECVTSSGVVGVEPDGRVYVRKVANEYGGYKWSFAKGRLVSGLSPGQSALKELREEMGLEARITGVLGDYRGDTGTTRFYVGEVSGGDPAAHGPETEEVRLVTREEAQKLLNKERDRRVLADMYRVRPDR